MGDEFKSAIEALQRDLAELERQASETKQVINRLCVRAGQDAPYPDAATASNPTVATLRPDSFYGKSIITAAREFLDMRRSAGLGPATPREVYEALVKGGYTFEAKEEVTAIIGVRATLRKSSSIFHRLPNGTYGLLGWYPNAKAARTDNDEDEGGRRTQRKSKVSKRKTGSREYPKKKPAKGSENGLSKADKIRKELAAFLAGGPRKRAEILKHMRDKGLMGSEQNPLANLSAYLSRWKDFVTNDADGNWSLVT